MPSGWLISINSVRLLITVIVVVAAVVRVWGLDFGLPFPHSRPDEVAIAGPAIACLLGDCRPPDFYYPSLVIYAVAGLYGLFYAATTPFGWYDSLQAFADSRHESLLVFFLVSRGLSAAFGTLTVYWVYNLGRRAADRTTGLVAALFLALAMLHVRDSHFGMADVVMTGLIVVGVTRALVWLDEPTPRNATLAGVATGLAASAKYNGLGAGVAFAVAALVRIVDGRAGGVRGEIRRAGVSALAFGAMLLIAFLATTPYIAIEPDRFAADVFERGEGLAGSHGVVLGRGWAYHPVVTLPAATGWPVYVCAIVGAVWWLAADPRRAAVVLAFPAAYFVVTGSLQTVFARYVVPLVPFLALAAAWCVVRAVERLPLPGERERAAVDRDAAAGANSVPVAGPHSGPGARTRAKRNRSQPGSSPAGYQGRRPWLGGVAAMLLIAPSALDVLRFDRLLTREDTRVAAARALSTLVRDGQTLYHSGGTYGHVPFDLPDAPVPVREVAFDEVTGRFVTDGLEGGAALPDWLVIQRSPLVGYSHVPETIDHIAATRYRLVTSFDAFDERPGRVFDQQDAFFCPLSGLAGVARLGPNIFIHERLHEALAAHRPGS